jgi:methionine-R-sulfoxide reductase
LGGASGHRHRPDRCSLKYENDFRWIWVALTATTKPEIQRFKIQRLKLDVLKWPDVLNLAKGGNPAPDRKVVKTDAEWRAQLSDEEYHVTRQAGTERAFSSEMCSLFEPGIYSCLCCETVLFDASEKFESGTGWPSFTQPIKENVIAYLFDGPSFLQRVETVCNTCDAHLGHVFPDGPAPSGLRYCMNAVALRRVAKV